MQEGILKFIDNKRENIGIYYLFCFQLVFYICLICSKINLVKNYLLNVTIIIFVFLHIDFRMKDFVIKIYFKDPLLVSQTA